MKLAVLGLWHLGCVYAAGGAAAGHKVTGWDHDAQVVEALQAGTPPLSEPGLENLISAGLKNGTLTFEKDLAVALAEAELIWITYDTPVDECDRADSDFVLDKMKIIVPAAGEKAIILVSSQLPAGSVARLENMAREMGRGDLEFACSPENLRLGQALAVFSAPDRIVCGVRSRRGREALRRLWSPLTDRLEFMKVESAEMTKHAINSFLAVSVVYANEIALICEQIGADAREVERGLKTESRIGEGAYVGPGLAFAGGTLARDIAFLSEISQKKHLNSLLLEAAGASNERHKMWVIEKLRHFLGSLAGKTVAIWGLTYKPGTSTLRRSLALESAGFLLQAGAVIHVHDPAVSSLPGEWSRKLRLFGSALEAARGAEAVFLCTPWAEYRNIKADEIIEVMRKPLLIDPTGFLRATVEASAGLRYVSIGYAPKAEL